VLVTGAGRGLGRAYALLLAARGAHVVVHDAGVERDGTGEDRTVADHVVAEIREGGGEATAAYENLASREACLELIERIDRNHGKLDALVHNAGIARYAGLEETDPTTWEHLLSVMVEAPLWLSRRALPLMKRQRYGRMVLTISGHGMYRTGASDLAAYSVCKAAAYGLMNVLADEGASYGVLANAISPVAKTRMYRALVASGEKTPEQVAPAVVYLASARCSSSGLVVRAGDGRFSIGTYAVTEGVDLGRAGITPEAIEARWGDIVSGAVTPAAGGSPGMPVVTSIPGR
jgi:NAD(P)-dependent dehydrogenase (short-subunit alcohol dehydrogenase family)